MAPAAQGRQYGGEGLLVDGEVGGDLGRGVVVDHVPEGRVVRVGGRSGAGHRLRLQPVAPRLEGVPGQGGRSGTGAGVHRGPVDGHARHPQFGGRAQGPARSAVVAAQGADDHGRLRGTGGLDGRLGGVLEGHGQHRVRRHLDEDLVALLDQGAYGRLEADGPAEVAVPVVGVHGRGVEQVAGDGGVQRDPGRERAYAGQRGQHLGPDPFDLGRVRGVVHGYGPGPYTLGGAVGEQFGQGPGLPRDHDGGGPVDGGHRQLPGPGGDLGADPVLGQGHRDHAAESGQRPDRPAAQGDDLRPVLQAQRSRHHGGGDLSLAVPDHGVGPDAPGLPVRGQ